MEVEYVIVLTLLAKKLLQVAEIKWEMKGNNVIMETKLDAELIVLLILVIHVLEISGRFQSVQLYVVME
jgi:hypothetical protein